MKKIKNLIIMLCFATTLCCGFGHAYWFFDLNVKQSLDNVALNVDPIRENIIFNDGYDIINRAVSYYDVYFFSQSINYPSNTSFLTKDGTITDQNNVVHDNYVISQPYQYDDDDFGCFKDNNNLPLTSDINNPNNKYFKKLTHVSEISNSLYESISFPIDNLKDKNGYDLNFLCWTITPQPIYAEHNNGGEWPTNQNDNQVDGYYPYQESFEVLYTNTLLSRYDSIAIYINKTLSILVFPVYTTGKNYYGANVYNNNYAEANENGVLKDSITLIDSNTKENYATFIFDGKLTQEFQSIDGANIYMLSNVKLESSISYTIRDDYNLHNSAWPGGDNPKEVYTISGVEGNYNFYLVVKEDYDTSNLVWDEPNFVGLSSIVGDIDTIFSNLNIGKYMSNFTNSDFSIESSSWSTPFYRYDFRSFYVYLERVYEPRLLGGDTNSLDYNNELSAQHHFVRQGISGDEKNRYELDNVTLNGDSRIEYELPISDNYPNKRILSIPNNFFVVRMAENDDLSYSFNFIDDSIENFDYANNNFPYVEYSNGEKQYFGSGTIFRHYNSNADNYDPNNQQTLFIKEYNSSGEFIQNRRLNENEEESIKDKLIRPKENGVYTIDIDVKYSINAENGASIVNQITLYGFKLSSLFINIVEDVTFNNPNTGQDNNNYINTDNYLYRKANYSLTDELSLDDVFIDATIQHSELTLRQILQNYQNNNKCLMDYVSKRYITLDNIDPSSSNFVPFIINKNYVFVVVDLPTS